MTLVNAPSCAAALLAACAILAGCREKPAGEAVAQSASSPPSTPQSDATAGPDSDTARRLAILDNSFRAIEDGDQELPRDRWDPAYVIEQVGADPSALFAWVRDNTSWIPYRGVLRGPVGVLMDRQGNSLDRALLLATLLQKAGHSVRLAHGELTHDQAHELLPALVMQRALTARASSIDRQVASDDPAPVQAAAAQYHLDVADVERSLNSHAEAVSKIYSELDVRVVEHSQRLLEAVGKPKLAADWNERFDAAVDACRDHWWVQRQDGDTWTDLDLLHPDEIMKAALTTPDSTGSVGGLDASLHHEIVVRVVAEQWSEGALSEERILEHTVRPAELVGDVLVLQFWPSSWPAELNPDPNAPFGFRAAALQQTDWTAVLMSNRDVLAEGAIRATGTVQSLGGNPFGGLGGGIVGLSRPQGSEQPDSASGPQLTAVWIEYQFQVPGHSPRTVRRVVLDLLGPSLRVRGSPSQLRLSDTDRLTRSLALMMRTELLPMAAGLAPEFAVHMSAQSVLGNRHLLRTIAQPDVSLEPLEIHKLLADTAPGVSSLYAVALARFASGSPAVFVDRLNLLTRHQYPAIATDGIRFNDAIDIVSNEVGVDLTEVDGFTARLAQGVLDTNVEALLHVTPWAIANTAEAFNASHDWLTISPTNPGRVRDLQVSANVRSRITADLDAGHAVVVPGAPLRTNDLEFMGWWQIDPVTGDTLGIGANGWGQAMAERGVQYNVLVEMAKEFAFNYAFCQAVPQVANQAARYLEQYRDQLPWWLPPLAIAKSPGAIDRENKRGCLIGAMIGTGITATLPFLIMTLKYTGRLLVPTGPAVAVPTKSGVNPFARTEPGVNPLAKTEPGANPLAKTEPGANPLAKTEPGANPEGGATPVANSEPGASPLATSQAGPTPTNSPPAPTAADAQRAAEKASLQATRDYVRYRSNTNPANPDASAPGQADPNVEAALRQRMLQADQENIARINDLRAAQQAAKDAAAAARGPQGRGGFPPPNPGQAPAPNFPGCPPNCGNNNPTGPAAVEVPGAMKSLVGLGSISGSAS